MTGPDLELAVSGRMLRFPAIWLRDNCPCPECVAPGTTQKLKDITDLPNGVAVTLTEHAGDSVMVTFAPDQHRATFSRAWLTAHALGAAGDDDERTEDGKQLWLPGDLAPETGRFPQATWSRYLDQPAERIRALEAVLRLGFVLLRDVPPEPGTVLEVAASFGFIRETNYGRLFDVQVQVAPGNLAFTSRAIGPHTDNPYRDPVPTVQLLHCLRAAGEGGDTGLVDGFAAAGALRAADAAGSAGCASITGRCGRCGDPPPRSPRSTLPTGAGPDCSLSPDGSSTCGWRPATAWSSTTRGYCTPARPSA